MTTINSLTQKMNSYLKVLQDIELRRIYWQENTKPLLQRLLIQTATYLKNGLSCQVIDQRKNNETVNLTFGSQPSGLFEDVNGTLTNYIKRGGTLVFVLEYTGQVSVHIMFPYIETLSKPSPTKLLSRCVEPKTITDEFIMEQIEEFLDQIAKWESDSTYNQIGFLAL